MRISPEIALESRQDLRIERRRRPVVDDDDLVVFGADIPLEGG
jgi:hypothetical protein